MSLEQRVGNSGQPLMSSSIRTSSYRPGMAAALSFVLAVAACSKKEQINPQAAAPSANPAATTTAAPSPLQPGLAVKKVVPVVNPGLLPPNPRVPLRGPSMADASAQNRLLAGPLPSAQPAPSEASASTEAEPVAGVHTPEQSKQARLQALQAMFRQRDVKKSMPRPGNSPAISATSHSTEKNAHTKTKQ